MAKSGGQTSWISLLKYVNVWKTEPLLIVFSILGKK